VEAILCDERLTYISTVPQYAVAGRLRKFKRDDGMSDSECDQPFVLSRVAAVADD
jgi:hypothetical protein